MKVLSLQTLSCMIDRKMEQWLTVSNKQRQFMIIKIITALSQGGGDAEGRSLSGGGE
jgi:hypothetical protein